MELKLKNANLEKEFKTDFNRTKSGIETKDNPIFVAKHKNFNRTKSGIETN